MVRLVSCGVGECRQGVIDREKERDKETSQTRKGRKKNIEHNTYIGAH
jgi:hypothetical protein